MRHINSSKEIELIRRRGHALRGECVTVVALPGEPGVAVIAGRNVGGAVVRNRAKRRVKSCLRERDDTLKGSLSVLIICKRGADRMKYQIMAGELDQLFVRLDEWNRSAGEA